MISHILLRGILTLLQWLEWLYLEIGTYAENYIVRVTTP